MSQPLPPGSDDLCPTGSGGSRALWATLGRDMQLDPARLHTQGQAGQGARGPCHLTWKQMAESSHAFMFTHSAVTSARAGVPAPDLPHPTVLTRRVSLHRETPSPPGGRPAKASEKRQPVQKAAGLWLQDLRPPCGEGTRGHGGRVWPRWASRRQWGGQMCEGAWPDLHVLKCQENWIGPGLGVLGGHVAGVRPGPGKGLSGSMQPPSLLEPSAQVRATLTQATPAGKPQQPSQKITHAQPGADQKKGSQAV